MLSTFSPFTFPFFLQYRKLTLMNSLRSALKKNIAQNLSSRTAILGATGRVGGARAQIMQNRTYTTGAPRKGGSSGVMALSKS